MDRQDLVERLERVYAAHGQGVVAAYLFGSAARGEAHSGSDVDVGVLLAAGRPRGLEDLPGALLAALERELRTEVDLVVLNGAGADLLHRVLRDAILVHEGDHKARIEFEIHARNEYFDIRPMILRYRRAMLESA